ncbi:putative Transcriptional regulator, TetR family protein [Vibrio nigripulchritudo MADA3029]|uniref:Transcriptional regulator, TetR family protein n=2 Tax=Vibrio nigripulchritudo TaxID=28173 RepID=A0AAV2VUJ6_9VIBR|nr:MULTISPECIES: TetR/AcrR family transcriptional regulator [Vibrio]KJY73728.1 TetR family transcriptional regulator [Vibrio nigripulchritudo]UAB73627.1 TetR family transcriptional regulator [Vibrio sp. SCSIO 43132]CCN35065.1 putative Transcriptional regulator, TetR family protein [Vibrio nigripulchritudo AM115]CCN40754.1 putative Transcriptional regulator, TetR family protein [Vibrio nigripulchritudo FTn2]CCN46591.1 putative Transcriptional regulator, TetR family protein [Vibrio nigripulchrit
MANQKAKKPIHQRDSEATKERILQAAKYEFAQNGYAGARVDEISERSETNKRMIYHYFGGKQKLFKAVLEQAYFDIRKAERALHLEEMEPERALTVLVEFTWQYYLDNPEFLTLVNSENLHKAEHLKSSEVIESLRDPFVSMIQEILKRGVKSGVFREDVDPVQLIITMAAVSYYYFTNRYTGSILFNRDLMAEDALKERLAFNVETILRMVKA